MPACMEAIHPVSRQLEPFVNQIVCGDAATVMARLPEESVHLIVTSPPYWNLVDYGVPGQIGQGSYERYLEDLLAVWRQAFRVLVPNGKLCINTPIVPVPKKVMNESHTRHYKNLNNDIEASILNDGECRFERFSLYIWQKQTSVKMFGSYPYPPNIYEDNTIEFINVLVKPGRPRKLSRRIKEASRLPQDLWLNLTMQVWPIYPEDVSRTGGHPAPFPVALPQRLILMYTFAAVREEGFEGDIVLDPFAGSGATCVAARAAGRRYIGIDINEEYCAFARRRLELAGAECPNLMLRRLKVRRADAGSLRQPAADSGRAAGKAARPDPPAGTGTAGSGLLCEGRGRGPGLSKASGSGRGGESMADLTGPPLSRSGSPARRST